MTNSDQWLHGTKMFRIISKGRLRKLSVHQRNRICIICGLSRCSGCSDRCGWSLLYSKWQVGGKIYSTTNYVKNRYGQKLSAYYFDARTKIHLQNYLNERNDDNPALFISIRAPHERLKIGGIECRLRELGKRLDIPKVHPHKFRRTLATMAIDKGMPIEQLQQLLGHKRIDTTLQYAMVKQSNVKMAHRKYIG